MPQTVIEFLQRRRSLKPDLLAEPAPTADELATILRVAARVPDHKKLAPWRFIIFQGDARRKMGEIIAEICAGKEDAPSEARLDTERTRFLRAPLVVGVISKISPHPGAPEWEQILSAGASAFNLCLAANALGYGTSWVTEWIAYNDRIHAALGLAEAERVAGFIHIGTAIEKPDERPRPDLDEIVTHWLSD